MKRKTAIILFFLILAYCKDTYAVNIPKPKGLVNDFAGVISSQLNDKMTTVIKDVE